MQQFIYYYKQLYMFRASMCPSSGVLDCMRIILLHINCCIKWVSLINFIYDARTHIHQIKIFSFLSFGGIKYFVAHMKS